MTAITTGVQLQRHLENGGYVQLNNQGGLETQSGISHLFQKIGDAFKGLSTSGQRELAERNTRLHDAIESILRQGDLPNLGETRLPGNFVDGGAQKTVLLRMAVDRMVRGDDPDVPGGKSILADCRKSVQERVLRELQASPPADRSLQGMRAEARRILNQPIMLRACKSLFTVDPERTSAVESALEQSTIAAYIAQKQGTKRNQFESYINEDGFHADFLKDASRDFVSSINGQALRSVPLHPETRYVALEHQDISPNEQAILEQMTELVPDPKMRGFVTMMACQAGLEATLFMHIARGTPPPDDGVATWDELMANNMKMRCSQETTRLNITNDGVLHVICNLTVENTQVGDDGHEIRAPLARNAYEVVAHIPLNQDLTGKDVPDFTISGFRHVQ